MSRADFRFAWRDRHVVRPGRAEDHEAIVAMLRALASDVAAPMTPKVDVASLRRHGPDGDRRFDMLVAEAADATLDGLCLYGWTFSGWRGAAGLFVADLYVAPTARGIRLGRGLLAAAIAREAENGAAFIKLDVDHQNIGAIGFYEKLGFHVHHGERVMILEADLLPALADE